MNRCILALALTGALGAAACGVDAESDTGLLLMVTMDDSVVQGDTTPEIAVLRFYLAVQVNADTDTWVLNESLAGRPVEVLGHDLVADPYRLFIAEDGDGDMETVQVLVVGEKDGQPVLMGSLADPEHQTLRRGKILSRTIRLRADDSAPALTWTRTGCLMSDDGWLHFGSPEDQDCDGYLGADYGGDDCNDQDASINPAADDSHDCDGKDNDCDGTIDPGGHDDFDGDGVSACDGDCDDDNPAVKPGEPELCDGVDNNCNGKCDEGMDEDGDGFTPCKTLVVNGGEQCVRVPLGDCDDTDDSIRPGIDDEADGRDNNCNGLCDEDTDLDGDGYNKVGSMPGHILQVEPGGECTPDPAKIDCKPDDPAIHPGAVELCDGVNTDCNNDTAPPDVPCYAWQGTPGDSACMAGYSACNDGSGDWSWGECLVDVTTAEVEPAAYCAAWGLCVDTQQPDRCIDQTLNLYDLECDVLMWEPGLEPCVENPPTYYLPFGFTGMSGCTWYLQIDYSVPGWMEVGLIDPVSPTATPNSTLHSCDAALVARPHFDDTPPADITGTISFVDHSGANPYLLVMPFSIGAGASSDCLVSESMACQLNPSP